MPGDPARVRELRRAKKAYVRERLRTAGGCIRCGVDDPVVLDWHHVDPAVKVAEIGTMAKEHGWDALMAELDKCVVVCANCHRRIHHELRGTATPDADLDGLRLFDLHTP